MTMDSLKTLKEKVLQANLATVELGLVKLTFGNASGIDREQGRIIIKPSGFDYDAMTVEDMVETDLSGNVQANQHRPSSDLRSHIALYEAFPDIGAIIHTHSTYATIFAQARLSIKPLGTTHADYYRGTIPLTRELQEAEISNDYVGNTANVIIEAFEKLNPNEIPGVLVSGHGPFVWGKTPEDAISNAFILEEIAKLAWHVQALNSNAAPISDALLTRHYDRKHGSTASYGQIQS